MSLRSRTTTLTDRRPSLASELVAGDLGGGSKTRLVGHSATLGTRQNEQDHSHWLYPAKTRGGHVIALLVIGSTLWFALALVPNAS